MLAGHKRIETRDWEFPYPPGWIGLHASLTHDRKIEGIVLASNIPELPRGPRGALVGIAWIASCRRLERGDMPAALLYGPNRYAWVLTQVTSLVRPVQMRGPQKFVGVPRAVIEQALAGDSS
jgi:hypothetical protein